MKKIKKNLKLMNESACRIEKIQGHSNGIDRCIFCGKIEATKGGVCIFCREKKEKKIEKDEIRKERDFLRELIRDIMIEIMDGRLDHWQKTRRICTWCAEYEDEWIWGRKK